ncbi:MAG: hypothetical protein IJA52_00650 [Clostridia bacterium]|nr:hypothetical protein [Clostridia bacterium]
MRPRKQIMTNKKAALVYYISKALMLFVVAVRIIVTILLFANVILSERFMTFAIPPSIICPPAFMYGIMDYEYPYLVFILLISTFWFALIAYPVSFLFGLITFKTNRFDAVLIPLSALLGISDLVLMIISIQDSFYTDKLISCIISGVFILMTSVLLCLDVRYGNRRKRRKTEE